MKVDELPDPKKWWKRSPGREHGDKDDLHTYAAVGGFLTMWERLEDSFARLYVTLVEGSWAAKRSYGTIMSNSGRRDALRAAGEIFFELKKDKMEVGDQERLATLLQHFDRASKRRDEIAHGSVENLAFSIQDAKKDDRGFFLVPPQYNAKMTRAAMSVDPEKVTDANKWELFLHNYRYTSEDIRDIREKLTQLRGAVLEYRKKLRVLGWSA